MREDYNWARRFLGLPGWQEHTEADREMARQRAAEAAMKREAQLREAEAAVRRECARAAEIWRGAAHARGTLVETWLEARSIDLGEIAWPLPTLRFLVDCPYWFVEDGDAPLVKVHSGPAMVAAIQNGKTKLSFTGSTATGRSILEASARSNLKRTVLELGGKSPVLGLPHADPQASATAVAGDILFKSGQYFAAGTRVYVDAGIAEAFTARLVSILSASRPGNGMDPASEMVPIITSGQANRVGRLVSQAVSDGGTLLCGGGRTGPGGRSAYRPPGSASSTSQPSFG